MRLSSTIYPATTPPIDPSAGGSGGGGGEGFRGLPTPLVHRGESKGKDEFSPKLTKPLPRSTVYMVEAPHLSGALKEEPIKGTEEVIPLTPTTVEEFSNHRGRDAFFSLFQQDDFNIEPGTTYTIFSIGTKLQLLPSQELETFFAQPNKKLTDPTTGEDLSICTKYTAERSKMDGTLLLRRTEGGLVRPTSTEMQLIPRALAEELSIRPPQQLTGDLSVGYQLGTDRLLADRPRTAARAVALYSRLTGRAPSREHGQAALSLYRAMQIYYKNYEKCCDSVSKWTIAGSSITGTIAGLAALASPPNVGLIVGGIVCATGEVGTVTNALCSYKITKESTTRILFLETRRLGIDDAVITRYLEERNLGYR